MSAAMAGSIRIVSVAAGVAMAGLVSVAARAGADDAAGQAYLCARARVARAPHGLPPLPIFHPRRALPVVDRYSLPSTGDRHTLDVVAVEALCRPFRLDGGEASEAAHGFAMYRVRRTQRRPMPAVAPPVVETITSALDGLGLRVGKAAGLALPTLTADDGNLVGPAPDSFACHDVRVERTGGGRRPLRRRIATPAAAPGFVEIRAARRLCAPASVRGEDPGAVKHAVDLLCYEARAVRAPGARRNELVATRNAFGNALLEVKAPRWLCVVATSD